MTYPSVSAPYVATRFSMPSKFTDIRPFEVVCPIHLSDFGDFGVLGIYKLCPLLTAQ